MPAVHVCCSTADKERYVNFPAQPSQLVPEDNGDSGDYSFQQSRAVISAQAAGQRRPYQFEALARQVFMLREF
jgi:hypothetical protein